jgi:hypothetical protein
MRVDMNWRAYPFLDYTLAVPPARYLSNWRRSRLSGSGDVRKSHVLMMGLSSGPAVAASREEAEADLNYLLRRCQKTPLYNPFKPSLQGGLDHGRYLECQLSGVYRTGSSPMRTIAICFTRWSLLDGYFVCSLQALASGELARKLNLLDPHKIWTWDPRSRQAHRGYPKKQLPMWHRYRVELYPHVAGFLSGIRDPNGHELEFPSAFRQSRRDGKPRGIIKLKPGASP